jgi:hypothetical protein
LLNSVIYDREKFDWCKVMWDEALHCLGSCISTLWNNGISLKMTPFQAFLMGHSTYTSFLVHSTGCWSSLSYGNLMKCYMKESWIKQLQFCVICISETPPPAYSPPEDSQHGQSTALTDPSAMDTGNIISEVAPVSYQVNMAFFFYSWCL